MLQAPGKGQKRIRRLRISATGGVIFPDSGRKISQNTDLDSGKEQKQTQK
jgi:hypothetical protein